MSNFSNVLGMFNKEKNQEQEKIGALFGNSDKNLPDVKKNPPFPDKPHPNKMFADQPPAKKKLRCLKIKTKKKLIIV